ncbi:MAG TPA: HAMP domain-containing sensor histidine kinase [Stellaceae bacterium]|nr:HAMP domain-containing sensor histidine kinase [Stellaceae bacterium]
MFRFRSVVGRAIALHLVAIVVTSIFMPLALYLMLKYAAQDLHQNALRDQAAELAKLIDRGPDGALRIHLTARLADLYSVDYGRYSYAVGNASGQVLLSSFPDGRAITPTAPPISQEISFSGRYDGSEIFGISVPAEVAGENVWIEVSQDLTHRDVLIDDIVTQFFTRVGWITAPILLLLLVIDVAIIRRALRPVVAASRLAEQIGPLHTDLRLPEAGMPREVQPLVRAVNQALDRLEEGFRGQREFTADAAHELRTPLAILRTQIDMIGDRELAQSLRNDVENMSRLVNQLLEMAELETFVIGRSETADLVAVASEVAAFLAPIALARDKSVAVTGARKPVLVSGNAEMLSRAVRNLVENALVHTPVRTTVEIEIDPAGSIVVSDRGPGVPAAEREQIFRRFWRRDRRRQGSSGLGLSIVARIAERHRATISVDSRPGGGAVFTLAFSVVLARPAAAAEPELATAS